jgi:hypothetical protein
MFFSIRNSLGALLAASLCIQAVAAVSAASTELELTKYVSQSTETTPKFAKQMTQTDCEHIPLLSWRRPWQWFAVASS